MSARIAGLIHRWRIVLSLLTVAGALVLSPRAEFTRIDNDLSAWFLPSDPVYRDYDRLRDEFTGSRTLIVALEGEGALSARGLDALRRISADIEQIAPVERVYSLATANTVEAVGDGEDEGIEITSLVPATGPVDAALVRARALADPMLVGDLVSADGGVVSLVINFDEDRIDAVRGGVIERIREAVRRHLPPGVTDHYNGSIEISETYNRVTVDNTKKFTAPILLLTLVALYVMFRSWPTTLLTMFAVLVSVLWTLGLYSLMGFTFNVLSGMLVPLVVVLAIADDVHIVQHYNEAVRRDGDRAAAFKATVAHLWLPLLAASGTTALGMLSLATSQVNAVETFGIGAAVGVMVDFAISLVLRPDAADADQAGARASAAGALAPRADATHRQAVVPASRARDGGGGGDRAGRTGRPVASSRRHEPHQLLCGGASAVALGRDRSTAGCRVSTASRSFFEGAPESLREPATLARMDRLGQDLGALPNVRKVVSIVDYLKRINRELNGGRPDAAVLPAIGRPHGAGAARLLAVGRRTAGAGVCGGERLLEGADDGAPGVDELGRGLRADSRGTAHGRRGLRGHRGHGDGDGFGASVRPARSLSRHVAAEQLRHRLRHRVRGHLHCLPIVQVRRAGDSAQRVPGGRRCSGSWAGSASR